MSSKFGWTGVDGSICMWVAVVVDSGENFYVGMQLKLVMAHLLHDE